MNDESMICEHPGCTLQAETLMDDLDLCVKHARRLVRSVNVRRCLNLDCAGILPVTKTGYCISCSKMNEDFVSEILVDAGKPVDDMEARALEDLRIITGDLGEIMYVRREGKRPE